VLSAVRRNVLIAGIVIVLVLLFSLVYYAKVGPFRNYSSSISITSATFGSSLTSTSLFGSSSSSILTTTLTTTSTSVSSVALTASPANQNCSSSDSRSGNNLSWTGLFGNGTMNMLVLAVNSSSTANLCILYTHNPEASAISDVNISAYVTNNYPQQNEPTPGVSAAAQPSYLNFGNSSSNNQQFFVKVTISFSKSSSGYYLLGISGLCEPVGLVINQDPSTISASEYSSGHIYEPSCGPIYGAVGELVGVSGLSYGYANVPGD